MLGPGGEEQVMAAMSAPADSALFSLHYAYPATVFVYYILTSIVATCTLQTGSSEGKTIRRIVISVLLSAILTYLCQLLAVITDVFLWEHTPASQDSIISLLSCILVFGLEFAWLCDSEKVVWHPYIGSLCIALVLEPVIETLYVLTRTPAGWTGLRFLDISAAAARWVCLAVGLVAYLAGKYGSKRENGSDAESQALLGSGTHVSGQGSDNAGDGDEEGYGSTLAASDSATEGCQTPVAPTVESPWQKQQREGAEQVEKRLREDGNWLSYAKGFLIFFPYIWPVNDRSLQLRVILVGLCLLAMNFVNLMIPRQLGIIIDSLNGTNKENPWTQVLVYAGLRLVASESGLSLVREWLWIPVENYSSDAMNTAAYSHVLSLSCNFHDSKGSSDITTAIDAGESVSRMLESICFKAIPMLIDMCVAYVYLSVLFGPYEGFISIATACIFFYTASRMYASIKNARRKEVNAYYEEHYVRQSGIQGWTTVTYFNQVEHEEERYSGAIKTRIDNAHHVTLRYYLAFALQHLVLLSGLLAGALLAVYQVTHEQITSGQFMSLLTYWAQMVGPLNFFANLGRTISRELIGAEQLLDIMQTKPTVDNKEGAPPLNFVSGCVRFKNVWFSYDNKKDIIKDISLTVEPGTTVAFVGATGAGKSTILKLLDRFYDVTSGSIEIDDQDIRDVDIYSLRARIGVVPQSPMLFDDTVIRNVRYARLDATDEEVYEACMAACIHEQILGFTNGYHTRVGERGVKLSGGELQRIAIARAILKRPSIVLLDEATSAVDTETEQKIQEGLRTLTNKRTTLVVAHRLSTIMNADRIVVISDGAVIEDGTHNELIRAKGKYAELWSKQVFVKPADSDGDDNDGAKRTSSDDSSSSSSSSVKTQDRRTPDIIVNDLTPQAASTELAKVNEAPAMGSPAKLTTPNHKKEGSKLNPDAPTFTPRSLANMAATSPARLDRSTDGYFDSPAPNPGTTVPQVQHLQWAPVFMYPAPFSLCPPVLSPVTMEQQQQQQQQHESGYSGAVGTATTQRGEQLAFVVPPPRDEEPEREAEPEPERQQL